LISLHSTDYFGFLLDIGDFGLPQNQALTRIVEQLQEDFSPLMEPLLPDYRNYIIPYTRSRLKWFAEKWGTLDPKCLAAKSTAARFEVLNLMKITGQTEPWGRIGVSEMDRALHHYLDRLPERFIALNGIFSGRKTAQLLNLSAKLEQAGIDYAVQVECSRFLAQYYPALAGRLIQGLIDSLEALP